MDRKRRVAESAEDKAVSATKIFSDNYQPIISCCAQFHRSPTVAGRKFLSVNTARPLEESHIRRQAQWKKAKSKDLLAMRRQDTTGV